MRSVCSYCNWPVSVCRCAENTDLERWVKVMLPFLFLTMLKGFMESWPEKVVASIHESGNERMHRFYHRTKLLYFFGADLCLKESDI